MSEAVLEHDHQELAVLLGKFEKFVERKDFPAAFSALDLFWARLAMHIRAEHVCLFPAILAAPLEHSEGEALPSPDAVQTVISRLRADHNFFMDQLAQAIGIMRDVVAHPEQEASTQIARVRAALAEVKLRLEEHNRTEEELVYRWPERLLNQAQLDELRSAIKREIENLPPRFSRLT